MRPPDSRIVVLASVFAATVCMATSARADDKSVIVDAKVDAGPRPTYFRAFATTAVGLGVRFNNPFRLATPIGDRAESASTTPFYGTIGVGAAFGNPHGFQHGALLRYDRSLQGVAQNVLTPSYMLVRRGTWLEGWGRFGLPLLLTPDVNLGAELAAGGAMFVTAGIGISFELIGDVFYGAATPENKRPIYPVLSGQLGIVLEWERLP